MKRLLFLLPLAALLGCPSQQSISVLATTMGTAAASIAAIEGNPQLAQKIQADTQVAVSIIDAWKTGTPTQEIITAINIVIDDVQLIPMTSQNQELIVICLAAADEIIAELNGPAPVQPRQVWPKGAAPTNRTQFAKLWNPAAQKSGLKVVTF